MRTRLHEQCAEVRHHVASRSRRARRIALQTTLIVASLVGCGGSTDVPSVSTTDSTTGDTSTGSSSAAVSVSSVSPIPEHSASLVLVLTNDWADFAATLSTFERQADGAWVRRSAEEPAVVGRAGLGWGVGLHGRGVPAGQSGPEKREGDGRAPAGVFGLGSAFGYADSPPTGARVPYHQSTLSWVCVDDGSSAHYNRVVDASSVASDWASAERLLREDPLYERLILVDHNGSPPQPGLGSCIFVHVWRTPERGTDGCYASSLEATERVIASAIPGRSVLVALPRSEYSALRESWGLP